MRANSRENKGRTATNRYTDASGQAERVDTTNLLRGETGPLEEDVALRLSQLAEVAVCASRQRCRSR